MSTIYWMISFLESLRVFRAASVILLLRNLHGLIKISSKGPCSSAQAFVVWSSAGLIGCVLACVGVVYHNTARIIFNIEVSIALSTERAPSRPIALWPDILGRAFLAANSLYGAFLSIS
jgi:hypothetical protein